MSPCPEEATLRMLGGDALGDATYAAIEQHVECCPDCKLVLEQLAHRRGEPPAVFSDHERLPCIPGFEIQRVLDRGAISVVYLADDRRLNRPVAIKVLPEGLGTDESTRPRRRWLREAQAISSVRHPNVVPLYDHGEVDGWLFLVLEYVPGGSLKQKLVEPLPPRAAAALVEKITHAVGHLHRHGLIHLDLKPSNILLDGEFDGPWDRVIPRITDFGLALLTDRDAASETSLAGIRGTPSYMAPEQTGDSHAEVKEAADIHGLGAILYHTLTGRPPFQGTSTLETLDQVRGQPPVAPRRLNPKIPRDLETIALKCLEKVPSRRYATADAMADDLRRWLDGRPIQARPVSHIEHSWRWCRRKPAVAFLAAAFLLAATGGFLGMSFLWRRAELERGRADRERAQAQAAQARAESDTRTATRLVYQLIELNAGRLRGTSKILRWHDMAALLTSTRRDLLALSPYEPNRERFFARLDLLDYRLGDVLPHLDRRDELRALLEESLRLAEAAVRQNSNLPPAWAAQLGRHTWLASIAESQGRTVDCEAHLRRAVVCANEWLRLDQNAKPFWVVTDARRDLARHLASHGRQAEARELLLADHDWRLHLSSGHSMDAKIVADRVFSYVESRRLGLGALPLPTPDENRRLGSETSLASVASENLSATAWASLAAVALHFDEQNMPADFDEVVATEQFIENLVPVAGGQRHRRQIDQARQTVDRMVALARLVVQRNPAHPRAYSVLAIAFDQAQKNAWRPTEDRPTIELNMRRAVEAAAHAVDLAPGDDTIRYELKRLQEKLEDFLHP